jgi:putative endonuclease
VKQPCVYLLANKPRGTLYVGVTSNIVQRAWQHRNRIHDGFAARHRATYLVWYEFHPSMEGAIRREKLLKKWKRVWKFKLIEKLNLAWDDLSQSLL